MPTLPSSISSISQLALTRLPSRHHFPFTTRAEPKPNAQLVTQAGNVGGSQIRSDRWKGSLALIAFFSAVPRAAGSNEQSSRFPAPPAGQ